MRDWIEVLKYWALPISASRHEREMAASRLLDAASESEGSRAKKLAVVRLLQRMHTKHPEDAKVRLGLAYGLYYAARDDKLPLKVRRQALEGFEPLRKWFDLDPEVRSLASKSHQAVASSAIVTRLEAEREALRLISAGSQNEDCAWTVEICSSVLFRAHDLAIDDPEGLIQCLKSLRDIYARWKYNPHVSLNYGIALFNTVRNERLSKEERMAQAQFIETWMKGHPDDDWLTNSVRVWLAKAIVSWLELPELRRQLMEVSLYYCSRFQWSEAARRDFCSSATHWFHHAESLGPFEEEILGALRHLMQCYPEDETVGAGYVFCLSGFAREASRLKELEELRSLASSGPNKNEAACSLIETLCRLEAAIGSHASPEQSPWAEARSLASANPGSEDSAESYADGLSELIKASMGSDERVKRMLAELRTLAASWSGSEAVNSSLASALAALSFERPVRAAALDCLEELIALQGRFDSNQTILSSLAAALWRAFIDPIEGYGRHQAAMKITSLWGRHSNSEEVSEAYALVKSSAVYGSLSHPWSRRKRLLELAFAANRVPSFRGVQDELSLAMLAVAALESNRWIKRKLINWCTSDRFSEPLGHKSARALLFEACQSGSEMTVGQVLEVLQASTDEEGASY